MLSAVLSKCLKKPCNKTTTIKPLRFHPTKHPSKTSES